MRIGEGVGGQRHAGVEVGLRGAGRRDRTMHAHTHTHTARRTRVDCAVDGSANSAPQALQITQRHRRSRCPSLLPVFFGGWKLARTRPSSRTRCESSAERRHLRFFYSLSLWCGRSTSTCSARQCPLRECGKPNAAGELAIRQDRRALSAASQQIRQQGHPRTHTQRKRRGETWESCAKA